MQRPGIAPSVSLDLSSQRSILFNELTCSSFILMIGEHATIWWRNTIMTRVCRQENDLVLFHNRGILHSVVGAFKPTEVRAFHQCNLAASDDPQGPNEQDVQQFA
jgi:hypothetical protein